MTLGELYSRKRWWCRQGDGNGWVYVIAAGVRGNRKKLPLYIGKTVNSPRARITQHICDQDLIGLAIRMKEAGNWAVFLLTVDDCIEFQSECSKREQKHPITDLTSAEKFMIRHWGPLFNSAVNRRRGLKIHKDFLPVFAEYRPRIWGQEATQKDVDP